MKKYMQNSRSHLYLLLLMNVVYSTLTAIVPIVAGRIIDYDAKTGQTSRFFSGMRGLCIESLIIFLCLIASGMLKVFAQTKYIYRVRKQIEEEVFHAAIRAKISSSSLVNMFCTEIDIIIDGYFANHGEFVSIMVPFIIALGYSISVSWLSIIIIAGCFVVLLLLNQLLLFPMSKYMVSLSKNNESVNKILLGFLNTITSLKMYGGIGYAFHRIQDVLVKRNKVEIDKAKYEVFVEAVNCLFSTMLQILPLAVIAIMVVNGKLTIGAALSIMLLFEKIVSPIEQFSVILEEYAKNKPARIRIEEFISESVKPEKGIVSGIQGETDDLLDVKDLCVNVGGKPIIKDFGMTLENGKKYLVIGKNGAGKSTLLKVLSKQINDYDGVIHLRGKELKEIPSDELFKTIGIISQNAEIFEDSILNNITLGTPVDYPRVLEAMKFAGLPKDRLQEKVMENWSNFSGGELQRIVLARMFYNPKQIYFLDEVVSGLQYEFARFIENAIIDHIDTTIINVSHRTDTATMQKYDAVINMNLDNSIHKQA